MERRETSSETSGQMRTLTTGKRRADRSQDGDQSNTSQVSASMRGSLRGEEDSKTAERVVAKAAKRLRTNYMPHQLAILTQQYERSRYLSYSERVILAEQLDVTEKQIKIWFQNRRSKDRQAMKAQETVGEQTQIAASAATDSGPGGSPIGGSPMGESSVEEKVMISDGRDCVEMPTLLVNPFTDENAY